jgi:hypothetical protein
MYTPTIGIFFNGENRYNTVSQENHRDFINLIKEKYRVNVYDLTIENIERNVCPYIESGSVQLWDFVKSIDIIQEEILIKLRTDLWITPSATNTILAELEKTINNDQDVSFLGYAHKNHFSDKYKKYPVLGFENVRDLVIIVNKKTLLESEKILDLLKEEGENKSGNLVYGKILKPTTRAYNVYCQLYLIRKNYDKSKNNWMWDVGKDFLFDWNPKKSRLALEWYETTRNCYDSI